MPTMRRLDKSRPHKLVTDFTTGRRTYHQDGEQFTEQGMIVLGAATVAGKYLCPKCDFHTLEASAMVAHASRVHHASERFLEVLAVYIQNIDRGLAADEGIDWHILELMRTPAQTALDEMDEKTAAPAEPTVAAPTLLKCVHCPSTFKSQPALAAHSRRHKGRTG